MSVPGPPRIKKQPFSLANTIKYWWDTPLQPNGTISAYKLVVSDATSIVYTNSSINPNTRIFTVGPPEITLTNGTVYSATLQAINENGEGEVATYYDWQPGTVSTVPPATATVTALGSNAALISWNPPAQAVNAPINWYTIISQSSNPSDPVYRISVDGVNVRNYYISGLNPNSSYTFKINAVNCPGYSPPANTNVLSFGPPNPATDYIFEASFPSLENTTGFTNYDTNRLMVNTPTGVGYSYITTANYTGTNSLTKSFTSFTTNTVSFVCSIFRTGSLAYAGLMMIRPSATGFNMFNTGINLGYIWNDDPNTYNWDSGITIPTNQWTHVALTITSSNAKFYVNGQLAVNRTGITHNPIAFSFLGIGIDPGDVSGRSFPGYMDNIRFYNRTLTDAEVNSIYQYYQAPQTSTAIPNTVTGIQAWYDAADPLGTGTPPASGSTLLVWSDKSGNARNASGVNSPTYNLVNYPYINFNGTNQSYNLSTGDFIANQYFTIFIVERIATSTSQLLGGTNGTNNNNLHVNYQSSTSFRLGFWSNDLDATGLVAFTSAGAQPIRIWVLRQIVSQRSIWLNGSPVAQDTNNTLLGSWGGAAIGTFFGTFFSGRMMDVIFYTGTLSIQNMQNVLGYLAQKWYVSLPPFIPFRVSGLALWLDANDESSFRFSSGSNISQWRDKSGNGNHFSVLEGTPTRIIDGSRTVVNFPSAGAVLQGTNSISITTNFSIFGVAKVTGTGGMLFSMTNQDDSVRYSGVIDVVQLGGGPGAYYDNNDIIAVAQVNASRNAVTTSTYTNYHMWDGPSQLSSTAIPRISDNFMSRYFIGTVCEILVFNTPMINLNREKIQGYLAWKWGINSLIPSTHTYYSVAPSV